MRILDVPIGQQVKFYINRFIGGKVESVEREDELVVGLSS